MTITFTNYKPVPIIESTIADESLYYYLPTVFLMAEWVNTDYYSGDVRATIYLKPNAHLVVADYLGVSWRTAKVHSFPRTINVAGLSITMADGDKLNELYIKTMRLPLATRKSIVKTYIYFVYWCGFYGKDNLFHISIADLAAAIKSNLNDTSRNLNFLINENFIERVGKYCFGNEKTVSYKYKIKVA